MKNKAAERKLILEGKTGVYRHDRDWAKIPEQYKGYHVSSSSWGPDGYLYVAVRVPEVPILVLDREGNFVREIRIPEMKRSHGLSMTDRESMWVADDGGNRVFEISLSGEIIRILGDGTPSDSGYESKESEYRKAGIHHDLWIELLTDSIVRPAGPFNRPTQVAEAADGSLFVADGYGNCCVHHFSKEGDYLSSFGAPGREPGQFRLVHGISIDSRGNLLVSDRQNSRVQIFRQDGELVKVLDSLPNRPAEIFCGKEKTFVGGIDGGVAILDENYEILDRIGFDSVYTYTHGVCADEEENLYLSSLKIYPDINLTRLTKIS